MTTPEHHHQHHDALPSRPGRAEHEIHGRLAGRDRVSDADALERVIATQPEAFAAFLRLPDADPDALRLGEDFEARFYARYESVKDALDAQMRNLGWQDAVSDVRARWGITDDELVWNYPMILARIREAFDIVIYGGNAYVFSKRADPQRA